MRHAVYGGGSIKEQELVCNDLAPNADSLKASIENGIPALFVSGGYQVLGTSYELSNGDRQPSLGLFNFYTKAEGQTSDRQYPY